MYNYSEGRRIISPSRILDAAIKEHTRRAVLDRIGDEHARPLLSQYLETAGRGDFIHYNEARKDWELE